MLTLLLVVLVVVVLTPLLVWYFSKPDHKYPDMFNRKPAVKEYDLIEITWLPSPRNAPGERNCYIGSKGMVTDLDEETGWFSLKMDNGAILLVHGDFKFRYLDDKERLEFAHDFLQR